MACSKDDITWFSEPDGAPAYNYWATCSCGWQSSATHDIHQRTIESELHLEGRL